jgi:hypothetical protein
MRARCPRPPTIVRGMAKTLATVEWVTTQATAVGERAVNSGIRFLYGPYIKPVTVRAGMKRHFSFVPRPESSILPAAVGGREDRRLLHRP